MVQDLMGYKKKKEKKWVRSLGNMEKKKRGNGARGRRESAKGQPEIARKSAPSNPLFVIW